MKTRSLNTLSHVLEFALGVVVVGFAINLASERYKDQITDTKTLTICVASIVLLCLLLWLVKRKTRIDGLKSEFAVYASSEALKPEDLDFKTAKPGDDVVLSKRPYYETYISRVAIPYKDRLRSEPSRTYREKDLVASLGEGNSILLVGAPMEGKTRTLFEVIKRVEGFTVISPKREGPPSDDALQLLADKKVVCLINDLNSYAHAQSDVLALIEKVSTIASYCAVAATCRDGPELDALHGPTTPLSKLYESFTYKLALRRPSEEDKIKLQREVGQVADGIATTLGSICMKGALEIMIERINKLDESVQDCHRAMQILAAGSVEPFSYKRIQAILEGIFDRATELAQLRGHLNKLSEYGLVRSFGDADPVIPEDAYVVGDGARGFYFKSRIVESDLPLLAEALKKVEDAEGLFRLAWSRSRHHDPEGAINYYDQLVAMVGPSSKVEQQLFVSYALINKGGSLGELKKPEKAIECYNEVINRFGTAEELGLREQVATALFNKGTSCGELRKPEQAIECYSEVINRFGTAEELGLRERVASALFNKGTSCGELRKPEQAIECYDEVINRFGTAEELGLRERVASALVNKGVNLDELKKHDKAIECYDDIIIRFGAAEELGLREPFAKALLNKGVSLDKLKKPDKSIECYDDIIIRFGAAEELGLREHVASTLVNKGFCLNELKKHDKAIECCEEVINRFGTAEELGLREQVAQALVKKGFSLNELKKHDKAIECYDEVINRFGAAEESGLRVQVAQALVNKGFSLNELKKHDKAIECYDEVINGLVRQKSRACAS
jgi:tetratricopeptide (TPR) repeat protein